MWFIDLVFGLFENLTWCKLYGPDELIFGVDGMIAFTIINVLIWGAAAICQYINAFDTIGKRSGRRAEGDFFLKEIKNKKIMTQYRIIVLLISIFLPLIYLCIFWNFDIVAGGVCIFFFFGPISMGGFTDESLSYGVFGLVRSINFYMAKMSDRQDRYDIYHRDYQTAKNSFKNINI